MRSQRSYGIGSILLGIGIAVTAILGPLWLNVIRQHISENVENQVVGADAVSLVVVAPLAVVAGVLWLRGSFRAPIIALGPAIYSVYIYFQYITGSDYVRYDGNSASYFPLLYGVLLLGLIVAIAAWTSIETDSLPEISQRVRVATASVLLVLGVFMTLAWSKAIYDFARGGRPDEFVEQPALWWLVKTMDLSFVIPALFATGVGLLLRHRAAVRLAYGLLTALALLAASVGSMSAFMTWNDDPSAEPAFAVVLFAGAAALAILLWNLVRAYPRASAAPATTPPPPQAVTRQQPTT